MISILAESILSVGLMALALTSASHSNMVLAVIGGCASVLWAFSAGGSTALYIMKMEENR